LFPLCSHYLLWQHTLLSLVKWNSRWDLLLERSEVLKEKKKKGPGGPKGDVRQCCILVVVTANRRLGCPSRSIASDGRKALIPLQPAFRRPHPDLHGGFWVLSTKAMDSQKRGQWRL